VERAAARREPPLKGASPRQYGRLLDVFSAGSHQAYLEAGGRPLPLRPARALALAGLTRGLDLVDLGCGRGEVALHAARRGCRVTAVDFSLEGLAMTRETARLGPQGAVDLVGADVGRLPLADHSADRVLILDVVEHLPPDQVARTLAEVRRILRPSGRVVVHTLPNRHALAVYRVIAPLVRGLPADPRSSYERIVHVNEQSPQDLRRALERAGFHSRVWVEEWTTRYAAKRTGRVFPDRPRREGYPALSRPWVRAVAQAIMATPAGSWVGNDVFAVAWLPDGRPPATRGSMDRVL
jgi:ubiquinone/menaquinone biosynthesis C-methylase UbiE